LRGYKSNNRCRVQDIGGSLLPEGLRKAGWDHRGWNRYLGGGPTSLYMYPGGIQARKKEKKKEKKNNRKEESLHKTLERAEGYSEIIHMGASGGVTSAQSTDSVLNHGESLIKHLRDKKHLR